MKANIISIAAGKTKVYQSGKDDNSFESAYKKDIFLSTTQVDELGIIEDFQVDKRFHGGEDNAIHIGSIKHFDTFKELHDKELDKLAIGCNILIDNYTEEDVCVGDIYTIGDIKVEVSHPRLPCWKIGAIFDKYTSRFIISHMTTGWYVRVLNNGILDIKNPMVLEKRVCDISIRDLSKYLITPPKDAKLIDEVLNSKALSNRYKKNFKEAVDKPN